VSDFFESPPMHVERCQLCDVEVDLPGLCLGCERAEDIVGLNRGAAMLAADGMKGWAVVCVEDELSSSAEGAPGVSHPFSYAMRTRTIKLTLVEMAVKP